MPESFSPAPPSIRFKALFLSILTVAAILIATGLNCLYGHPVGRPGFRSPAGVPPSEACDCSGQFHDNKCLFPWLRRRPDGTGALKP